MTGIQISAEHLLEGICIRALRVVNIGCWRLTCVGSGLQIIYVPRRLHEIVNKRPFHFLRYLNWTSY